MVYDGMDWNRLERSKALKALKLMVIKYKMKHHGALLKRPPPAPPYLG
jgi:hypothetical protein